MAKIKGSSSVVIAVKQFNYFPQADHSAFFTIHGLPVADGAELQCPVEFIVNADKVNFIINSVTVVEVNLEYSATYQYAHALTISEVK